MYRITALAAFLPLALAAPPRMRAANLPAVPTVAAVETRTLGDFKASMTELPAVLDALEPLNAKDQDPPAIFVVQQRSNAAVPTAAVAPEAFAETEAVKPTPRALPDGVGGGDLCSLVAEKPKVPVISQDIANRGAASRETRVLSAPLPFSVVMPPSDGIPPSRDFPFAVPTLSKIVEPKEDDSEPDEKAHNKNADKDASGGGDVTYSQYASYGDYDPKKAVPGRTYSSYGDYSGIKDYGDYHIYKRRLTDDGGMRRT